MNKEIYDLVFRLLIVILSATITTYVIPWIKSKIDSTKYNDLLTLVEKCVQAAEKIYTPEEWGEKKQYVLNLTVTYCNEHNIDITGEELNALIEGFVKAVKGE